MIMPRKYSMFPDLEASQDPYSDPTEEAALAKLYKDAPEYRKRKRRAEALRKRHDKLEEAGMADIPLGAVTQGTNGGLFQTQGSYIPNYSGMMNKAMSGIGAAWLGKEGGELEKVEGEADELQSEKLLQDALIIGRRARAARAAGGWGQY